MDLFGLQEHDDRHDEVERQLRRLVEQVAQLTIDMGQTRTELRALRAVTEGKVDAGDVDPALLALNDKIKAARAKLAAAEVAADEGWASFNVELREAVDGVRRELKGLDEDQPSDSPTAESTPDES